MSDIHEYLVKLFSHPLTDAPEIKEPLKVYRSGLLIEEDKLTGSDDYDSHRN